MGKHFEVYGLQFTRNKMCAIFVGAKSPFLQEFLDNLSSMHFFISQIVYQTDSRPPSFKCEAKPDGSLRLHYYSPRQGFFPVVKGFVKFSQLVMRGSNLRTGLFSLASTLVVPSPFRRHSTGGQDAV